MHCNFHVTFSTCIWFKLGLYLNLNPKSKGSEMGSTPYFPGPCPCSWLYFFFLESIKCKHVVASSSGDSSLLLLARDGSVVYVELSASADPRWSLRRRIVIARTMSSFLGVVCKKIKNKLREPIRGSIPQTPKLSDCMMNLTRHRLRGSKSFQHSWIHHLSEALFLRRQSSQPDCAAEYIEQICSQTHPSLTKRFRWPIGPVCSTL